MHIKNGFLSCILAGAAMFTICAADAQNVAAPKRGGSVVVALGSEPPGLNPAITTDGTITMCYMYEGLVTLNNRTNEFEPALAESWNISPDGKTYSFKIRAAKWHDGTPVTSEDVRYTLQDVMAKIGPNFALAAGKLLESVNTPDARTVEIKLTEPVGPMLILLTCAHSGAILPAHLFKGTDPKSNPTTTTRPVGTGPFKFAEWVHGSHIRLTRNENYWDAGKPYLDEVVVRIMPAASTRTLGLIAGEVDFIPFHAFPPSDSRTVQSNPKTKREPTGVAPGMLYAFFNMKREVLNKVAVRRALLMATDLDYIFKNAFFELGRPGQGPWTSYFEWAHDPEVSYGKKYPFNPELAGKMLDEAGYKPDANGIRFALTLTYDSTVSERVQTANALQAMWKRVGVDVKLTPMELAVLLPRVHQQANFDVHIHGYNSGGDPALGIARTYVSSRIGVTFGNAANYSNPDVDRLFEEAGKLTGFDERGKVYKQIERILMEDVPVITLHDMKGYDVSSKKLQGAWGYLGHARLGNAWLEP